MQKKANDQGRKGSATGTVRALSDLTTSAARSRLLLFGAIGVFLTILAPFGTQGITPFWARGIYWLGMIYGGALISIVGSYLWAKYIGIDHDRMLSWSHVGLILVTSVPITLLVISLGWTFSPVFLGLELFVLYFYVLTITLAVTFGTFSVDRSFALKAALEDAEGKARAIHAAHENVSGDVPPPAFASRLKPDFRQASLLSLSAEDHYLDVATSKGHEQIRCSMADAALELAPLDGRVIHRSHWVARSAIKSVERHGNQTKVHLHDGRALPISRARLKQLRVDEWLPR